MFALKTAPLRGLMPPEAERLMGATSLATPGVDYRLSPHYRTRSPLEDVLRNVDVGLDGFVNEKYVEEIHGILARWSDGLVEDPAQLAPLAQALAPDFKGTTLLGVRQEPVRSGFGIDVRRTRFADETPLGVDRFMQDLSSLFGSMGSLLVAEFKVTETAIPATTVLEPLLRTKIRYDLVGSGAGFHRQERIGQWEIDWRRNPIGGLLAEAWRAIEEITSAAREPVFTEVTERALGDVTSHHAQLLSGSDYWRTVLDGASGIDVYGNNGVALGDVDKDGFDEIYVCQPAGLPNRLYRNRGNGTFEDITDESGTGVLDNTAAALFADFNNDGRQDLIVVRAGGPLLFINQGKRRFRLKPDAFRFAQAPQGTFTGAALADYDRDGRLDVYFCLYSYYQGLDQYQFPLPYYDAQNGPPNFLFHNDDGNVFTDVTGQTGLSQNNNRYSFACGWCDYNQDGWPDLYVANDFGRKNLYRNNGNGTFTDVAVDAGVEDVGAGMSVCWFDYDNDGRPDLYVADMWSDAGKRVSREKAFLKEAPQSVVAEYRKHADGNSLFRNVGGAKFEDRSRPAGVEFGRWAWSSDAWDLDQDGHADLYVANGMISGPKPRELESFFWRQVVAHSGPEANRSGAYEQGWSAINELIRSDGTWAGYQRNVFYLNNRNGSFSEISGVVGLDFIEDSRAFALSDLDHDGRLELVLKNRNTPQLRILQNVMTSLGEAIAFRLQGTRSNRDAIGAVVTVETKNGLQTKLLQAGSGFLSQHTKELFFGLGNSPGRIRATVRWPSGALQQFDDLSAGNSVAIEEGSSSTDAQPFVVPSRGSPASASSARRRSAPSAADYPSDIQTWLLVPLTAPEFSLPDLEGHAMTLAEFRGRILLLNFWAVSSPPSVANLRALQAHAKEWTSRDLAMVAVNVDEFVKQEQARRVVQEIQPAFSVLLATEEMAGTYNLLYRYLFDRRRDLGLPTSFLIDEQGRIARVYQGSVLPGQITDDISRIPRDTAARMKAALPFAGLYFGGSFQRNYFTYGIAFFQHGYLDAAIASFRLAIQDNPEYADAYYNLGTLFMKKGLQGEARRAFEQALKVRPGYPDALNNLGLIAAQSGQLDEALRYFQMAAAKNPTSAIALQNLGNLYRQQGRWSEAEQALNSALSQAPDDPEINYSLGMLFARQDQSARAEPYLKQALALRPHYPEALNNLGVLYLLTGRSAQAATAFEQCIQADPAFSDAYMNLARLYVQSGDKIKARQVLEGLLEHEPNNSPARRALDQLSKP